MLVDGICGVAASGTTEPTAPDKLWLSENIPNLTNVLNQILRIEEPGQWIGPPGQSFSIQKILQCPASSVASKQCRVKSYITAGKENTVDEFEIQAEPSGRSVKSASRKVIDALN